MNTTTKIAHDHALQGLLLLIVEVQNEVRQPLAVLQHVRDLVESPHAAELIQLARAALETPADTRKVFYGIVTQYDISEVYRNANPDRPFDGPIIFEQYLRPECMERSTAEALAARHTAYGWCHVAEIRVEIPSLPAAIPAAAASTHD